ncbi:hypothetical protein GGF40_004273 [Coemansia sp. RSA 1286]|nr:hypothetical protein GGF40_004273 [Coemansia sp. RSA 1286]
MFMVPRALACRNTEVVFLLLRQRPCPILHGRSRRIRSMCVVSSQGQDTLNQGVFGHSKTQPLHIEGVEAAIWDHLQHGNIHKAVAASIALYQQPDSDRKRLRPLTQFMLAKRQLSIDSIYAGAYVLQRECVLSAGHLTPILAALLADTDPELINLYTRLAEDVRRHIDSALLATLAYHFAKQGWVRQFRRTSRLLSRQAQADVKWALGCKEESRKESKGSLALSLSKEVMQGIDAAWMLRRPITGLASASDAGDVVMALLRAGIVPDLPALKTLISLSVHQRSGSGICMLYASRKQSFGFSEYILVRLAEMRVSLGRQYPRIHYDVLGTLVRSGELGRASTVAAALKSRHAFHFLLQLWTDTFKRDWKAVGTIVRTLLRALDAKVLHSTHHLAITAILGEFKRALANKEKGSKAILQRTLSLHWQLAPRLESPSIAAVHQLLVALSEHGMMDSAFDVYRDLEKRKEWAGARSKQGCLSNEAIVSVLAKALARKEDIRSIMHLANMATRTGVRVSSHFYSAVVLGLTDPRYLRPAAKREAKGQQDIAERVQMAEAIVGTMRKNSVAVPPKLLFSIMHAWALLGHIRKTRAYFYRIKGLVDAHMVSEIPWSMLMYANMRARDVRGVFGVLNRAREWLQTTQASRQSEKSTSAKTSYLVNIAMAALIQDSNSKAALSLLDSLGSEPEDPALATRRLTVTPADPVTLNLIVGALLAKDHIQQAIEVYDSIRSQYGLGESVPELRRFMQHCIRYGHLAEALEVYQRILRNDHTLKESQWISLMSLCLDQKSYQIVPYLFDCLCVQLGLPRVLSLFKKNQRFAESVCQVLAKTKGRDQEVSKITELFTSPVVTSPEKLPNQCLERDCKQHSKAEKTALYRRLFRAAKQFPLAEMRRKLCYNVRFGYELYRHLDHDDALAARLMEEGEAQVRWLRSWQADPEIQSLIVHRPMSA